MAIIQDIDKGGGEIIRVEISEFKGQNYLNIRVWYMDKNTEEYRPTQKGISIRPELYKQLREALDKADPVIQGLLK